MEVSEPLIHINITLKATFQKSRTGLAEVRNDYPFIGV